MMKNVKVLLLVAEPWRKDDSGGNTLDNFVHGMQGVEFAQIYCDDRMPENDICDKYFQISQSDVVNSFLKCKSVGKRLSIDEINRSKRGNNTHVVRCETKCKVQESYLDKTVTFMKRFKPNIAYTLRHFIWFYSNWKTKELNEFILSFNPDVIYAPCYADPFMLSLTRYVKNLTKCRVITWSADDCYSLRHFSLDPFFWLNRFWNRRCLRKTYPYYDEFYSISEEEAEELEPIVNNLRQKKGKNDVEKSPIKIGILRKGVLVPDTFISREVHRPIKFIYAGGLYLNRHKSLIEIANTLRKLNQDEVLSELHIYSGTQLSERDGKLLNDGRSVFNHGLVSPDELSKMYQESDVAIHCESFDLKYRLMTRLSFSTKIIDCFQSGCAILAIAWNEHTGIKCLQRENAAFCVTSIDDIENVVTKIVENPELIEKYAMKAYKCMKKNHRIEDVQRKLYDSFVRCSK